MIKSFANWIKYKKEYKKNFFSNSGELILPSEEKPPKAEEKKAGEKKKDKGSFFQNLISSLTGGTVGKQEIEIDQGPSEDAAGKSKDKSLEFPLKPENKGSVPQTKDVTKEKSVSSTEKEGNNTQTDKGTASETDEDSVFHLIENFKAHEKVQLLSRRKAKIIKAVAITVSFVLIIIAIIYGLGPTEEVASNVIFGERAMFSVFLVLVAFLILAAVFAGRLLEGKYLKSIHQDLEIVEGKRQKDDDKNSSHDPTIESMNKRDK